MKTRLSLMAAAAVATGIWSATCPTVTSAQSTPSTSAAPSTRSHAVTPADWNALAVPLFGASKAHEEGEAYLKSGNLPKAVAAFQEELKYIPNDSKAYYGLAKCAEAAGDIAGEISWFRRIVFSQGPAAHDAVRKDGFREIGTDTAMEFAILLSENGQTDDSLAVYRYGLELSHTLGPVTRVVFPDFKTSRYAYSSTRLEAMAEVIRSIEDYKNRDSHLARAVALAPTSSIVHYYRGMAEYDFAAKRKEWELAEKYDDGTNRDAIQKALRTVPRIR